MLRVGSARARSGFVQDCSNHLCPFQSPPSRFFLAVVVVVVVNHHAVDSTRGAGRENTAYIVLSTSHSLDKSSQVLINLDVYPRNTSA